MKYRTPVMVVAFNRPGMLKETLSNLSRCENLDDREIHLYVDGPRNVADESKINAVIEVAKEWGADLKIKRRNTNLGGVPNMIAAVSEMLEQYGRVIIIEDDILVSRSFLTFMDAALARYENNSKIWAINGYVDPKMTLPRLYKKDYFLAPRHSAWGWGTWKDRWAAVDFEIKDWTMRRSDESLVRELNVAGGDIVKMLDAEAAGELNAWDVQCTYYMRKNGLYTLRPRLTMTKNNGFGTECEHCSIPSSRYSKQKYYTFHPVLDDLPMTDPSVIAAFQNSFSRTFCQRLVDRAKRLYLDYCGDANRDPISVDIV